MSRYKVQINGKEFEVALKTRSGSSLTFESGGKSYTVALEPLLAPLVASSSATSFVPGAAAAKISIPQTQGPGTLVAPMPGIVANVLLKEGDQVSLGQTVLVVEAMKMENNIQAGKSGKLKKIHCKKGDEVQLSQLLAEIE